MRIGASIDKHRDLLSCTVYWTNNKWDWPIETTVVLVFQYISSVLQMMMFDDVLHLIGILPNLSFLLKKLVKTLVKQTHHVAVWAKGGCNGSHQLQETWPNWNVWWFRAGSPYTFWHFNIMEAMAHHGPSLANEVIACPCLRLQHFWSAIHSSRFILDMHSVCLPAFPNEVSGDSGSELGLEQVRNDVIHKYDTATVLGVQVSYQKA